MSWVQIPPAAPTFRADNLLIHRNRNLLERSSGRLSTRHGGGTRRRFHTGRVRHRELATRVGARPESGGGMRRVISRATMDRLLGVTSGNIGLRESRCAWPAHTCFQCREFTRHGCPQRCAKRSNARIRYAPMGSVPVVVTPRWTGHPALWRRPPVKFSNITEGLAVPVRRKACSRRSSVPVRHSQHSAGLAMAVRSSFAPSDGPAAHRMRNF